MVTGVVKQLEMKEPVAIRGGMEDIEFTSYGLVIHGFGIESIHLHQELTMSITIQVVDLTSGRKLMSDGTIQTGELRPVSFTSLQMNLISEDSLSNML